MGEEGSGRSASGVTSPQLTPLLSAHPPASDGMALERGEKAKTAVVSSARLSQPQRAGLAGAAAGAAVGVDAQRADWAGEGSDGDAGAMNEEDEQDEKEQEKESAGEAGQQLEAGDAAQGAGAGWCSVAAAAVVAVVPGPSDLEGPEWRRGETGAGMVARDADASREVDEGGNEARKAFGELPWSGAATDAAVAVASFGRWGVRRWAEGPGEETAHGGVRGEKGDAEDEEMEARPTPGREGLCSACIDGSGSAGADTELTPWERGEEGVGWARKSGGDDTAATAAALGTAAGPRAAAVRGEEAAAEDGPADEVGTGAEGALKEGTETGVCCRTEGGLGVPWPRREDGGTAEEAEEELLFKVLPFSGLPTADREEEADSGAAEAEEEAQSTRAAGAAGRAKDDISGTTLSSMAIVMVSLPAPAAPRGRSTSSFLKRRRSSARGWPLGWSLLRGLRQAPGALAASLRPWVESEGNSSTLKCCVRPVVPADGAGAAEDDDGTEGGAGCTARLAACAGAVIGFGSLGSVSHVGVRVASMVAHEKRESE